MSMSREERISEAKYFVWKGERIEATPALYAGLLDAHRRLGGDAIEVPVALGKEVRVLSLTPVEDLLDLCQQSQLDLARARAGS